MSVLWIARREIGALFASATGWLVLTGFLLLTGVFWVFGIEDYLMLTRGAVYNPYAGPSASLTDNLLLPFFGNCTVIVLMIAPALSMRLFAEELRQHTLELLMTSPLSTTEVVLGKFLGAVGCLALLLACTAHYPLSLMYWASPDPGVLAGGYAALLLLGSAIIALGMWFSSQTQNQILAVLGTFSSALVLYILAFSDTDPESWLNKLSISAHVVDLIRGAVRAADLAYFASFIGFFLYATHQRLEAMRWR